MKSSSGSDIASPLGMLPFEVIVDENFHYMDKDERWRLGTFATLDEAVAACRNIVESCLAECYKTGMDERELFSLYMLFGDDPFILGPQELGRFSAWNYAKARASEICGQRES